MRASLTLCSQCDGSEHRSVFDLDQSRPTRRSNTGLFIAAEKVLERGERIELLVDRTESLNSTSLAFKKQRCARCVLLPVARED